MSRRFVIAAAALSTEQEKAFRDYLGERGAWWHWVQNFWLLNTDDAAISATEIRDTIMALGTVGRIFVMEITEAGTWAAKGPSNNKEDMFKWLHETWPN